MSYVRLLLIQHINVILRKIRLIEYGYSKSILNIFKRSKNILSLILNVTDGLMRI